MDHVEKKWPLQLLSVQKFIVCNYPINFGLNFTKAQSVQCLSLYHQFLHYPMLIYIRYILLPTSLIGTFLI